MPRPAGRKGRRGARRKGREGEREGGGYFWCTSRHKVAARGKMGVGGRREGVGIQWPTQPSLHPYMNIFPLLYYFSIRLLVQALAIRNCSSFSIIFSVIFLFFLLFHWVSSFIFLINYFSIIYLLI